MATEKKKMGRPPKPIDFDQLDKLLHMQATEEECAAWFQVSIDTLNKKTKQVKRLTFSEYSAQKRKTGRISLRRRQWQTMLNGNVTMQIWLGKQYLGQQDKIESALVGRDGGPIESVTATVEGEKNASPERVAQILGVLNRVGALAAGVGAAKVGAGADPEAE